MKKNNKWIHPLLLVVILLLGWGARVWGINWDDGYHFHPDERMIIMVAERISWVNPITDWETFTSPASPMNPKFFAYGSLPIYLLAMSAHLLGVVLGQGNVATYDGMLIVGRLLSATFDTLTILIVFLIGKKIGKATLGLIAAGLYSLAVFPIQASHFFAVDTLLSLLVNASLLVLVSIRKMTWKSALVLGCLWGLGLGTKASALVVAGLIGAWLGHGLLGVGKLGKGNTKLWERVTRALGWGVVMAAVAMVVVSIVQPYMWYDKEQFWGDVENQSRMRNDAWTFPYTRQYIGTMPYVYHGEQIAKYGLGWGQTGLVLLGIAALGGMVKKTGWKKFLEENKSVWVIVLMACFVIPFGMYSVKFMRYLLPIYPGLALLGGLGLSSYWKFDGKVKNIYIVGTALLILMSVLWTGAFMSMYQRENTRLTASKWMWNNLDRGAVLAIEHWDDALPIPPWHSKFSQVSLALYESDTREKWSIISMQLERADAIVIASNRLYAPLMRLDEHYPVGGQYYQKLFDGELGFELSLEATNYPRIWGYEIVDDEADESFHVYDHPRVMVFVKKNQYTADDYYRLITQNKF